MNKILYALIGIPLSVLGNGQELTGFTAPETELFYKSHPVYSQIEDIFHPTREDFFLVQDYLKNGDHENNDLGDRKNSIANLRIIGNSPNLNPEFKMIAVNCSEDDRENCVITYASFNAHFPRGVKRLVDRLVNSDFKGHILYWIGGWPNVEGGSLVLAHVPEAFKPSAFKNAQALGFKRVLWLDSSMVPVASVNTVFDMISQDGYFARGNTHDIGWYMNENTANSFGYTLSEVYNVPSCSAAIFGIDYTKPIGVKLIDEWYRMAHDKHAFFSARVDQNALTLTLYKNNLKNNINYGLIGEGFHELRHDTLFILDRSYIW